MLDLNGDPQASHFFLRVGAPFLFVWAFFSCVWAPFPLKWTVFLCVCGLFLRLQPSWPSYQKNGDPLRLPHVSDEFCSRLIGLGQLWVQILTRARFRAQTAPPGFLSFIYYLVLYTRYFTNTSGNEIVTSCYIFICNIKYKRSLNPTRSVPVMGWVWYYKL